MRRHLPAMGISMLAMMTALAAGCAEERDPINRVQTNALAKSFFVGKLADAGDDPEFYAKHLVIDHSASQANYTIGETSGVDRVRFEITEDLLLVRKAYQITEGADNKGIAKKDWAAHQSDKTFTKTPNGTIVGAYKISSHFDVRRSINPSTGEEYNVIEENTTDRPWNEREYMRVDWSENLAVTPDDEEAFLAQVFGGEKVTSVKYTVSDPRSEDAPYGDEMGSGYFDITNKFTVDPKGSSSIAGLPACAVTGMLSGGNSYDCNPQEATVRTSFQRLDPNHDFESLEDSTAWNDVVGNPGGDGKGLHVGGQTAPRQGYDAQYGYTDVLTKRFKSIHDLWKKSHQAASCDSNDDVDANGTADACENGTTGYSGSSGSQCDVHVKKCTIPVRDRSIKSVGYFINKEAPDELQDELSPSGGRGSAGALEEMVDTWNLALEVAIAYRREVECRRTGDGDRKSCHERYFEGEGPSSKVMVPFGNWLIDKVKALEVDHAERPLAACHYPVRAYDPKGACGEPGTKARIGDIRKHHLIYWPYDSRAPYGGIVGWAADPLTGEIIGTSATIVGRSATFAAATQRDMIQLAIGDTKIEDIISGAQAGHYLDGLKQGSETSTALARALPKEERDARIAAIDSTSLRAKLNLPAGGSNASFEETLATVVETATKTTPASSSVSAVELDALQAKLRGGTVEAKIVDGSWATSVLGTNPSASVTTEVMEAASMLRGLDPTRLGDLKGQAIERLHQHGGCYHTGTDAPLANVNLVSLGGYFKKLYGNLSPKERGERIYKDLWKEAVKGIGFHEFGHSLGLYHNFASSWDSVNYAPQYWQLRTAEGKAASACSTERTSETDTCMGPRYLDPMTTDELGLGEESRPRVDYFGNTSTMEYPAERFGETVGMGAYDLHAMKALYGRVLETLDDVVKPTDQPAFGFKHYSQLMDRDYIPGKETAFKHYTSTARAMNLFDPARDCREATADEKAQGKWRIVHGKVCSHAPRDHWAWSDFKSDSVYKSASFEVTAPSWHYLDKGGASHVRWPYRFGQQYGEGGYVHVKMSDRGADVYELAENMSEKFTISYPWGYFRRNNAEWSSLGLSKTVATDYFGTARGYASQIMSTLGRARPTELASDDVARPYAMAQASLFRFLTKAVLMPEPGAYAPSEGRKAVDGGTRSIFDLASGTTKSIFSLDIGDARYIGDEFDHDRGGSWDYQSFVTHAGFEVEKSLALMQLVDSRPTLSSISRENSLDGRDARVSFRTANADSVDRLIGGILSEDWETVGPHLEDGSSTPKLLDLTSATPARPASAKVIFPNVGYKQELAIAMNAAIFSRFSTDMTLVNKLRITLDGDAGPALRDGDQVRFTDPETGYTYLARRFGPDVIDGKTVDRGIGSRMLQRANALLPLVYDVKRDGAGRPIQDAYGRPQLTGPTKRSEAGVTERDEELRRYVGLLDSVRQIGHSLVDGPLGGAGQKGGEN